ncbi:MAG TPA: LacI family DNA-binding transcriptional regulator [Aggregatilineales bacterium]|nr:LacI family DNA-binding transcriptional regulator [Aggregatilineales bacterium]
MNLEKIAQIAGVSRSTVSRVINNHPYVSDDARRRVSEVIEREGFHPSNIRLLPKQRTDILAVIAPEGLGAVSASGYFPLLIGGISTTISRLGYAMSLWAGATQSESSRMYKRVLNHRIMDGALLISALDGDTFPEQLLERGTPVVVIGNSCAGGVSSVDVDNVAAAYDATRTLIRGGRRRIAHLAGTMDRVSAQERLLGYRRALEKHGLRYDPNLVIYGDFTEESGSTSADRLLAQGIDGLFCSNDLMAVGFIRVALLRGVRIPADISVLGFDDLPSLPNDIPALSTVHQPIRQLGEVAVNLLTTMVNSGTREAQRVVLSTEVILRET